MDIRRMARAYVELKEQPGRCRDSLLRLVDAAQNLSPRQRRSGAAEATRDFIIDFEKALRCLDRDNRTLFLLVRGAGYNRHEAANLTGIDKRQISLRLEIAECVLASYLDENWATPQPGVVLTLRAAL